MASVPAPANGWGRRGRRTSPHPLRSMAGVWRRSGSTVRIQLRAANVVRAGGAFCAAPNPVMPPCDPAQNSTFGTLDIRLKFTNSDDANITRLRFRVVDITTFPSISGVADLRPMTSSDLDVGNVHQPPLCSGGYGQRPRSGNDPGATPDSP